MRLLALSLAVLALSSTVSSSAFAKEKLRYFEAKSSLTKITVTSEGREKTYSIGVSDVSVGNDVATFGEEPECASIVGHTTREIRIDANVTKAFNYGETFGSEVLIPELVGGSTIVIPAGTRMSTACEASGTLNYLELRNETGAGIKVQKN